MPFLTCQLLLPLYFPSSLYLPLPFPHASLNLPLYLHASAHLFLLHQIYLSFHVPPLSSLAYLFLLTATLYFSHSHLVLACTPSSGELLCGCGVSASILFSALLYELSLLRIFRSTAFFSLFTYYLSFVCIFLILML